MRTALTLLLAVAVCSKFREAPSRTQLKKVTGSTFELIPQADQLPYCLAYTVSEQGVIRQLTMAADNLSFECPGGEVIGHHAFRVPPTEHSVKVMLLFTNQRINAGSVSEQLIEAPHPASLTAMDLRLPGQATLEVLEFTATAEIPAEVGTLVGGDAGTPSDGGAEEPVK